MTLFSGYSSVASALTLFAGGGPLTPRLYLHNPAVVFKARAVLLDSADYPISFIAYDTVTVGAYTDVTDGMLLLLGTSDGGDQLGRQRIRGAPTNISIFVGRSSRGIFDGELSVEDNAYITVLDDYRVWARMPFIDSTGEAFKDSALEVEWRTTTPPPVSNCGQGFAGTIDPDTGVMPVAFNGQHSFATTDGATIDTYLWDIADGTLTGGSLDSDDNITTQFPAGFRYIHLTVTDSEGHAHISHCPVYARDPDDDTSFDGFQIESHRISDAGVTMTIRALQDMPRATYPDGTLAMMWGREPAGEGDRTHMLIVGWLDVDDATHNAGRTGLLRDTTLTILDVAAKLDTLPGLPQAVADDETRDTELIPDITWNYMVAPTMDKYMHYLWAWHSTALEVADFIWSDTGTAYQIAIKSSDGESLWNQAWRLAQAMCPGYVLTCDQAGAIRVEPDPMLQEIADRTSTVQVEITENDWSDLRFSYQRASRTHWLKTGALVVQSEITFNPIPPGAPEGTRPTVYLPTVFSWSPGLTPGQGLGLVENNDQLAASQDVLNNATGHRYARMNAATGLLTVTLIQDDGAPVEQIPWRLIEPAHKEWVTFTLSAANAAQRGLTFTTARCLPKEVTPRYNNGKTGLTRTVEVTLEPETSGQPGATYTPPAVPAPGDQPATVPPPIPPPDMGLVEGQQVVAGIGKFGRYKTADFQTPSGSGGPTYTFNNLTGSDEMLTWVVDPFSPGYAPGATSGSVDGWAATATAIYRIEQIHGTTTCNAVVTFATTALWRTIQASFGTYFVTGSNPWLICISYYGNAAGHTGTWCTYSKDGGATWYPEVLVSSFYDSGGASNPIGLFTSPRTPGFALTAAHIETANPAETAGFVSLDWGATWTAMAATETAPYYLPDWGHFNTAGTFDYLGIATRRTVNSFVSSTGGVIETDYEDLIIAPPANTKRMVVQCDWIGEHTATGTGSQGSGVDMFKPSSITRTGASNYIQPVPNTGPLSGSFTCTYTFGSYLTLDWPTNRSTIVGSPPANHSAGVSYRARTGAQGFSGTRGATLSIVLTVTEIELDDSTVYTPSDPGIIIPVHAQAGQIHIPFESNPAEDLILYGALDRSSNRQFDLKQASSGAVTVIGPTVSSIQYGVNHGQFAVRCHDSDRTLVLLAGTGNDTTASAANDKQGLWFSSTSGAAWTQRIAPTTSTEPYSAAFSGSLDGVVYIWGPATFIKYSEDNAATLDDRSGNLSGLSATEFIGICGGPS